MHVTDPQSENFLSRFAFIQSFVFDMDGVLTDGRLLVMEADEETGANKWYRSMHVRDGYALQLAARLGYPIIVISGSGSAAVKERLQKLGITRVFFDVRDKKTFLAELFARERLDSEKSVFMGDDIPDLPAMHLCGLRACPADAAAEIKQIADYVSPFKGGEGCVRDVIRIVLKLQGKWNQQAKVPST